MTVLVAGKTFKFSLIKSRSLEQVRGVYIYVQCSLTKVQQVVFYPLGVLISNHRHIK